MKHNIGSNSLYKPITNIHAAKFAGPAAQGVSDPLLRTAFKRFSFLRSWTHNSEVFALLFKMRPGGLDRGNATPKAPSKPPSQKTQNRSTTFKNHDFS